MHLYMAQDITFSLDKPYLYLNNIEPEQKYDICCDGSFINIGKQSFCCIGGIIVNTLTTEKIGEFFAPINTKDALNQSKTPNFEKISIDTALLIKKKYHLDIHHIFNDSLSEVSQYGSLIQWIPREKNIADHVVTYAKNKWKEKHSDLIAHNKFRHNLFDRHYEKNISITSYKKPKRCMYYFFALNEQKEIIDHVRFHAPHDFGEIILLINMINKHINLNNTNIELSKKTVFKLNSYIQGKTACSGDVKIYEDFFTLAKNNNLTCSLKSYTYDFNLKKNTILKYLGWNNF